MKKQFTLSALLLSLTGFSQTFTMSVSDTTFSGNTATITTTIIATTTITQNNSLQSFSLASNSLFKINHNNNISYTEINTSNLGAANGTLSGIFNTGSFDSMYVSLRLNNRSASTLPPPYTSTISLIGSQSVETITTGIAVSGSASFTNTNNWQLYSAKLGQSLSNQNTIAFSMYLGDVGITSCEIYLTDLFVKTYSTSLSSHTIALTNTLTTGIKNNTFKELKILVVGNTIKSNIDNENYKLKVFDIAGKQVFETMLRNEIRSDLNAGIYILNVVDNQNNLIKQKRILITNY